MGQTEYTAAVLADSPKAFYKLNEASGNPQDSSGNGFHMTSTVSLSYLVGGPFTGSNAVRLNSTSDTTSRPVFSTQTSNITFEFWMLGETFGTTNLFLRQGSSAGFTCTLAGGNGIYVTGNTASLGIRGELFNSQWIHCVIVNRAGTWEYYLNGLPYMLNAGTSSIATPSGSFQLFLSGSISVLLSNVSYYDSALSATRVYQHYIAGTDIPNPYAIEVLADSPLAFWKFDETNGNPYDSSGNGKHWDITNGTPIYSQTGPFSGSSAIKLSGSVGEGFETLAPVGTAVNNLTFEGWVKVISVPSATNLFANGQFLTNGWAVYHGITGVYSVDISGSGFTTSSLFSLGNFDQIVITRDSGTWKFYVNGELSDASLTTNAPSTPLSKTKISLGSSGSDDIDISNFSYYETVLSPTRIRTHYRTGVQYIVRSNWSGISPVRLPSGSVY